MSYTTLQKILNDAPGEHQGYQLNCQPTPYSAKDFKIFQLFASAGIAGDAIPQTIDYRTMLPPVFDQGQRGSCVACANVWTVKAYQEKIQADYPLTGLSAAFVYSMSKLVDNLPGVEGTTLKASMQVLQKYGVCTEVEMPYSTLTNLPSGQVPVVSDDIIQKAAIFKIQSYAQICGTSDPDRSQLISAMRLALKAGPFMLAILVCDNFVPDSNYILPLPNGGIRGGHAVGIVGDQPDKNRFILRNSWGTGWGDNGYAYLPYEWLTAFRDPTGYGVEKAYYLFEAWTATDIPVQSAGVNGWLYIGKKVAIINGLLTDLDVAPFVDPIANRTMVPLRFVMEQAGLKVDWNEAAQSIHFYK